MLIDPEKYSELAILVLGLKEISRKLTTQNNTVDREECLTSDLRDRLMAIVELVGHDLDLKLEGEG